MFKNDLIVDMVESLGKNIGKMLKSEKDDDSSILIDSLTGKDILMLNVKKLTYESKYSDAEDMLFEAIDKSSDDDVREVGKWFYNHLVQIGDGKLKENNFSIEEVNQGIKDLDKRLKNSN